MSDGGKGSKPRPLNIAQEQYDQRWDLIFGRDKGQKERDFAFDKAQDALERKATNARELGLTCDYCHGIGYDSSGLICSCIL